MNCVLEVEGLDFYRGAQPILTEINWTVAPKESAAIVGANGSGKSTLLRLISGYLWPTRGSVSLLGKRFGEHPVAELRKRIGVAEATSVYPFDENMTALDVACSGFVAALTIGYVTPDTWQWTRSREVLDQVGLADRAGQLYATLSTGQRMRVLIARALVRKPEVLLLDEPTAGLDLPSREATLATLAALREDENAPAIVMVTHHLEEILPGTSNILLLTTTGQTQALGDPHAVLTHANMTAAYGCPITVLHHNQRYHAHVDPQAWSGLLGRI